MFTMRLKIFEVVLSRQHEDLPEPEDLGLRAVVVCETAKQARAAVFEQYWHSQLDAAQYKPVYETTLLAKNLSQVTTPDVELIAKWLVPVLAEDYAAREGFESGLAEPGVMPAAPGVAWTQEQVSAAVLELAKCKGGFGELVSFLSEVTEAPQTNRWMTCEDADELLAETEGLVYA